MRTLIYPAALVTVSLIIAACGDAPTASDASRTAALAAGGVAPAAAGRSEISLNMLDACDAATFNAAVGPGTCQRPGGMKFDQFIAELTKHHEVQAWDFAPPSFQARLGQTIVATNRGGEGHTFTHVAEFGGGIIPLLNELSGNPVVAPECTTLEADDFIPPGGTYTEDVDASGTQKFQCCIHPWMRTTARVR